MQIGTATLDVFPPGLVVLDERDPYDPWEVQLLKDTDRSLPSVSTQKLRAAPATGHTPHQHPPHFYIKHNMRELQDHVHKFIRHITVPEVPVHFDEGQHEIHTSTAARVGEGVSGSALISGTGAGRQNDPTSCPMQSGARRTGRGSDHEVNRAGEASVMSSL